MRARPQEVTITGAGGVQLACELALPAGTAPDGGWPGLILFPGLGGSRRPMERSRYAARRLRLARLRRSAAPARPAARSTSPARTTPQDAQAIFNWLAARSDVSDTQIGALGQILGGAEVWNAAVAGVPFKAIVPADHVDEPRAAR